MSYTVVLLPKVYVDIRVARDYYASIRRALADQFLEEVQTVFETLESMPTAYQKRYGDLRRVSVKRFPYSVVYYIQLPDVVVVTAVVHQHRPPESWTP